MHDRRERPRAAAPERDSGFDVWIPALVALIAAIFMLLSTAHAAEAGDAPQPIYDAARFSPEAIAAERAAADAARDAPDYAAVPDRHRLTVGSVVVASLPDIPASAAVDAPRPGPRPAVDRSVVINGAAPSAQSGLLRLVAPGVIALCLLAALVALGRTWRRTEPLTV